MGRSFGKRERLNKRRLSQGLAAQREEARAVTVGLLRQESCRYYRVSRAVREAVQSEGSIPGSDWESRAISSLRGLL